MTFHLTDAASAIRQLARPRWPTLTDNEVCELALTVEHARQHWLDPTDAVKVHVSARGWWPDIDDDDCCNIATAASLVRADPVG